MDHVGRALQVGETPAAGVERETWEETGLRAEPWRSSAFTTLDFARPQACFTRTILSIYPVV